MVEYGLAGTFIGPLNDPNIQKPQIIPGRVNRIVLNINDLNEEEKIKYMGYDSLGMIFWESVTDPSTTITTPLGHAFPLLPNFKNYPLINEIVYIIELPGKNIQENTNDKDNYYFSPMNLYQNVHQNGIPNNLIQSTKPLSEQKNINDIKVGNTKKVSEGGEEFELDLGKTFKERNIRDLEMFEGDVTIQGRWGNSIRFGSTVKDKETGDFKNDWSQNGETGDAITIIRNGQPDTLPEDPWIPIFENVNEDKSSIYLTTNQKIPINISNNNKKYSSYSSLVPTAPSEFIGEQVILNSGRLLFNSKSDHIVMSSNLTISFNAEKGFNFDTPSNFVIKTGTKIMLGGKSNTEPSVLGNKLLSALTVIVDSILTVTQTLETIADSNKQPMVPVNSAAIKAGLILEEIKKQLSNILQPNVRIISNGKSDFKSSSEYTESEEDLAPGSKTEEGVAGFTLSEGDPMGGIMDVKGNILIDQFEDDPNTSGVRRKITKFTPKLPKISKPTLQSKKPHGGGDPLLNF